MRSAKSWGIGTMWSIRARCSASGWSRGRRAWKRSFPSRKQGFRCWLRMTINLISSVRCVSWTVRIPPWYWVHFWPDRILSETVWRMAWYGDLWIRRSMRRLFLRWTFRSRKWRTSRKRWPTVSTIRLSIMHCLQSRSTPRPNGKRE